MASSKRVALLRKLDIGKSVAESDHDLAKYFLKTRVFDDFIDGDLDVVIGGKGTGKSAIFRIVANNASAYDNLSNVIVVPVSNESGALHFDQFDDMDDPTDTRLGNAWKLYILSVLGNKLADSFSLKKRLEGREILNFLYRHKLRKKNGDLRNILKSALDKLQADVQLKSRYIKILAKFGYKPTPPAQPSEVITDGFNCIRDYLEKTGEEAWIIIDRLDEAFTARDKAHLEVPTLRALLRSILDMKTWSPRIQLKALFRKDLFESVTAEPLKNLDHIMREEIIWSDTDLYYLLDRRLREKPDIFSTLKLSRNCSDEDLFTAVFPDQVDVGPKRPKTWKWMVSRIQDGKGEKWPRNLIELVNNAIAAEYARAVYGRGENKNLISGDALRDGQIKLSNARRVDYLFTETGSTGQYVRLFKRKKAEQRRENLSQLLKKNGSELQDTIDDLVRIGFLQETGSTFKVPFLYRPGLEMIQGIEKELAESE